jgi:hypothetical protein
MTEYVLSDDITKIDIDDIIQSLNNSTNNDDINNFTKKLEKELINYEINNDNDEDNNINNNKTIINNENNNIKKNYDKLFSVININKDILIYSLLFIIINFLFINNHDNKYIYLIIKIILFIISIYIIKKYKLII